MLTIYMPFYSCYLYLLTLFHHHISRAKDTLEGAKVSSSQTSANPSPSDTFVFSSCIHSYKKLIIIEKLSGNHTGRSMRKDGKQLFWLTSQRFRTNQGRVELVHGIERRLYEPRMKQRCLNYHRDPNLCKV